MTGLEIFESLCPDVEPLSNRDRVGMRLGLFGGETPSGSDEARSAPTAVHFDLDRGLLRSGSRQAPRGKRLLSIAAVSLIVAGVAAVWFTVGNRDGADPVPAEQSSSTTVESAPTLQPLATPVWYDTIRPLLPDGFDQIVLTVAKPEVVSFKALRTGTRQLLDVTVTLQSGYDIKDTGEAITFSDEHGDYVESAGSVALTTPDQRRVVVRCGLRPIGGGTVEPGGLVDADRDTCDGEVDNLDIDPTSRRTLAAALAAGLPTDAVTPEFGQIDTSPEGAAVGAIVAEFAGDSRPFATTQADGVLRLANLTPTLDGPSTTELTVINGIWPPDGDGSAFDDTFANSPQGRFYQYGDIAVAFVVVDRTGYHIATTDLSDSHLTALGELLQQLITAPTTNTTVAAESALAEALRPDGRVLVVNASSVAGLAGSLSSALELSGYDVLEPVDAADGQVLDTSIMYTQPDMPNSMIPTSIANAFPIPTWETLRDQPTPALTFEMRDGADVIIVLGRDLADAPWTAASTPLIDPGIGRLLIVDAGTTDQSHQAATARADELRNAGVDVADIVTATTAVEETMLMPIGETTPWTYAIADLAGIGGFDTWTPSLIAGPIPEGVTAVLVIAN